MKFGLDDHGRFRSFRGTYTNDDPPGNGGGGGGGSPKPWEREFGTGDDAIQRMHTALENSRRVERTAKADADKAKRDLEALQSSSTTETEKLTNNLQKLRDEVDAAKRERLEGVTRAAVEEEARKSGAQYPDTIYALVSGKLEVGDDGKPKNAAAILKDFKAERPGLFTTVRVNGKDDPSKPANEQVSTGAFDRQVRGMFGRGDGAT